MGLHYQPQWDLIKPRYAQWWKQQNGSHALLAITAPQCGFADRSNGPFSACPPEGEALEMKQRPMCSECGISQHGYLADGFPCHHVTIEPGGIATFIGGAESKGVESIADVADLSQVIDPKLNPRNPRWIATQNAARLSRASLSIKSLVAFPALRGHLDALTLWRGAEQLREDLAEQPEEVHRLLRALQSAYFEAYDELELMLRDHAGGTTLRIETFGVWGPGRLALLGDAFSASLSIQQSDRFVIPYLRQYAQHVSHMVYHMVGDLVPTQVQAVLGVPELRAVAWKAQLDRTGSWSALHRQVREAGKSLMLLDVPWEQIEQVLETAESGGGQGLLITTRAPSVAHAESLMAGRAHG